MHFNEISEAIKDSDFKRKDVTTQAIHNELIKDKRFVLIGRGIYALQEWGYSKGTVADVVADVLTEAGEPLHRDEIVKRVLKRPTRQRNNYSAQPSEQTAVRPNRKSNLHLRQNQSLILPIFYL
jgi:hypothetical protein